MSDCYIVRRGGTVESSLSFPEFTYTGTFSLLDDGLAADGKTQNWRIKFLTSGTLRFTNLGSGSKAIDVFCVGGGGAGGYFAGGGGGGGYTRTLSGFVGVSCDTDYSIVVGAGGIGGSTSPTAGGTSSAFGVSASGGAIGESSNIGSGIGGKGGNGGSGGGAGSWGGSGAAGGSDGENGSASGNGSKGNGQGTTTREFGETNGTLYAGGGGGGGEDGSGGAGGSGGGGAGGKGTGSGQVAVGSNGTTNYGGGGGGGSTGGSGGSGIVVIRNAR